MYTLYTFKTNEYSNIGEEHKIYRDSDICIKANLYGWLKSVLKTCGKT